MEGILDGYIGIDAQQQFVSSDIQHFYYKICPTGP